MKKFGTPMGAGPGVDWEKLGFCGVGLPSGLVNTFADGAWRSLGAVWWLNPPFTPEAVCSVPRTGAPVVPVLGVPDCPDGAGEDEPEGDGDVD